MIEQVARGIYASDHRTAEGKNGIVFGTRRVLAIDTGVERAEGEEMAAFIRHEGREPDRVAVTHGHGDHVLGLGAFPGAEVYAHSASDAVIRRQVPGWARRAQTSEEEIERGLTWPTVTFSSVLRLDLGGRRVRLFPTPGHSADSVCAYVEEDRVLFGGDTVVTGIVPAFGDGDSVQMEASLKSLLALDVEALVPGHGPVLTGADRVRDWLEWMAGYLSAVRAHVAREVARSRSDEEIVERLPFDEYIRGRLSPERHGMPERHRNTARKMLAELRTR